MLKTVFILFLFSTFWVNAQEVRFDWKELNDTISINKYIENQAYKYLNFKLDQKDTTDLYIEEVKKKSSLPAVYIRDKSSIIIDKPLVLINSYQINDENILNQLKLSDIKKVTILKAIPETFALYGSSARYGVILIEMNKRKLRKIKEENGR